MARIDITLRGSQDARPPMLVVPSLIAVPAGLVTTVGSPQPQGAPGVNNTGPRVGVLTPSGSITASQPGQVIQGKNISGRILVTAPNVKILDNRITYNGTAAPIDVGAGAAGLEVGYNDIESTGASAGGIKGNFGGAGRANNDHGSNIWVHHNHIYGYGDGIKGASYGLYEWNYVHVTRFPGTIKHIDGMQFQGGSHFTVRFNYVDQPYSAGFNSCIFVMTFTGTTNVAIDDFKILNNWVGGAINTLQVGAQKTNAPGVSSATNGVFRDNIIYRPPATTFLYGVFQDRQHSSSNGGFGVYPGWWYDDPTHAPVPRGNIN